MQWNLTASKISTSSTKFVFFGSIGKTRLPPWPLIGWDIFDFSSETAEQNSTKLDSKQDLNVLYHVCVFRADRKNNMAVLASDWLNHFRLFLWNRWTEFNETWQEARSQHPLPSLYFSGRSVNKKGRPGRFFLKVARYTQVHDMWPLGPLVFFCLLLCDQVPLNRGINYAKLSIYHYIHMIQKQLTEKPQVWNLLIDRCWRIHETISICLFLTLTFQI